MRPIIEYIEREVLHQNGKSEGSIGETCMQVLSSFTSNSSTARSVNS